MKKFYFMAFIATAALTMMSCSNDDITTGADFSKNETTVINFSTYLGRTAQTRGTVTETGAAFGVFAYYTQTANFAGSSETPNFMYNQKVEKSGDAWTYSPIKYWPNAQNEKVSFFAYAPYSDASNMHNLELVTNSTTGTPTIKVTVPTDLTNSVDFVAATAIDKSQSTGTVSYELQHEMTRLTMQAKVSEDVYKAEQDNKLNKTFVVIKSIKFNSTSGSKIYNSGTYTFATTDTKGTDGSTVNRGTWSSQQGGTAIDFKGILKTDDVKATTAAEGKAYKTGVKGIKLTGTSAVSLFKDNQYAYLIPVDGGLTVGEDTQKETVTIEYDVVTEDVALADGYSCASATKTIDLPAGILKVGTSYTLTFTINVNKVELSASAADWGTPDSNGTVNVPASGSGTITD